MLTTWMAARPALHAASDAQQLRSVVQCTRLTIVTSMAHTRSTCRARNVGSQVRCLPPQALAPTQAAHIRCLGLQSLMCAWRSAAAQATAGLARSRRAATEPTSRASLSTGGTMTCPRWSVSWITLMRCAPPTPLGRFRRHRSNTARYVGATICTFHGSISVSRFERMRHKSCCRM